MSFTLDDRILFIASAQAELDSGNLTTSNLPLFKLLVKLNATFDVILMDEMLSKITGPSELSLRKNIAQLKSFTARLSDASEAAGDVDDYGEEKNAEPVLPAADSVANLFAFGVRSIETCCAAGIREPKGNAIDYLGFSETCTHFLRQCRRKPATEGVGCTAIASEHQFCRQHLCFQPKFVYTIEDMLPQPMDGSVLFDTWAGSSDTEVGPIGNVIGSFINNLDNIFRVSRADIASMEKKNKHQLDRFKQTVIENVKMNMDMLIQSARDNASGSALCDADEDGDLCEVEQL